jgi:hypothetical protein
MEFCEGDSDILPFIDKHASFFISLGQKSLQQPYTYTT